MVEINLFGKSKSIFQEIDLYTYINSEAIFSFVKGTIVMLERENAKFFFQLQDNTKPIYNNKRLLMETALYIEFGLDLKKSYLYARNVPSMVGINIKNLDKIFFLKRNSSFEAYINWLLKYYKK